jgi:hypothetical protein
MARSGGAAKGSGSKGCRGVEHGQTTQDRTGAVALRAALESAVQLGRGEKVNRQAEMAIPTKCRDSLQIRMSYRTHGALVSKICHCTVQTPKQRDTGCMQTLQNNCEPSIMFALVYFNLCHVYFGAKAFFLPCPGSTVATCC